MIELTDISYVNGQRHILGYNNRKKVFQSKDELEQYRVYLERKIGRQLFFTYKQKHNEKGNHNHG